MRIAYIIVGLLLLSATSCKNLDAAPEASSQEEVAISFQLLGGGHDYVFPVRGEVCSINMMVQTNSTQYSIRDWMETRYGRPSHENWLQSLSFQQEQKFFLKIKGQGEIPCALYHLEPPAFENSGLRMNLLFQVDESTWGEVKQSPADLIYNDSYFTNSQIVIPITLAQLPTSKKVQ